jgi:hypothetical protein
VDTGTPRAATPIPEVPKLIKPKVYQKTYQSGFLFHNYVYKSDIYKILMADGGFRREAQRDQANLI